MLISQCVRDSRCPFTERERQPENQKCNNNNNNNNGWKIVKNKGTLKVYNNYPISYSHKRQRKKERKPSRRRESSVARFTQTQK